MKERSVSLGSIKLNFRRGSLLLKVAVLVLVALSTVALLTVRSAILDARAQTEAMRTQAQSLEQQNSRLEKTISQLGTVQGIIQIAQQELDMVMPDSVVLEPENP